MPRQVKLYKTKDLDHPNRCQAYNKIGACMYLAEEGNKYCIKHGKADTVAARKEEVRMYKLGKYNSRVKEFGYHEDAIGLRSEIGILRMSLEELLSKCQQDEDENQLLLQLGVIGDLVTKINKIVTDCHKLEAYSGEHLTKTQVVEIAQRIMGVVANYVSADDLAAIAEKLSDEIDTVQAARFAVEG